MAGGYLRNANEERNFADTWRVWTVIFIACTVAWLMSAILSDFTVSQTGAVIWHKVALSFALSGVLLFGAAYSAQQSTRHRNAEKRTRWFALEVKAIDPFIHSLPEEQRQALKKELSERMFGHFTKSEDEKGRIVDEHAAGVLVKLITDVMKSIPRPGK